MYVIDSPLPDLYATIFGRLLKPKKIPQKRLQIRR